MPEASDAAERLEVPVLGQERHVQHQVGVDCDPLHEEYGKFHSELGKDLEENLNFGNKTESIKLNALHRLLE